PELKFPVMVALLNLMEQFRGVHGEAAVQLSPLSRAWRQTCATAHPAALRGPLYVSRKGDRFCECGKSGSEPCRLHRIYVSRDMPRYLVCDCCWILVDALDWSQ